MVKNPFGLSSNTLFQLRVAYKSYRQVMTPCRQFSALFKAGNSRQAQACNISQMATQRKCNIRTGSYKFKRNTSSHDLD